MDVRRMSTAPNLRARQEQLGKVAGPCVRALAIRFGEWSWRRAYAWLDPLADLRREMTVNLAVVVTARSRARGILPVQGSRIWDAAQTLDDVVEGLCLLGGHVRQQIHNA